MAKTGAELLIDTLIAQGIDTVFTLSGNHIMAVFDAIIERDLDLVHVRHEAAAVHMADAWGRLNEKPGVALVTAGPGHANALSALYVAQMAESPLVLLSGHAPQSQLGRGSFQEMDQVAMAKPVSKASWLIDDGQRLSSDLVKAFEIAASGRPGPVHLSIPADLLAETIASPTLAPLNELDTPTSVDVTPLLALLNQAKKPLLLAGPAMSRGQKWAAVAQFALKTGIPALPMRSPRGLNDPALHAAVNVARAADLILLLGKKLDFTLQFGSAPFFDDDCQFVAIEPEPAQILGEARLAECLFHEPVELLARLAESFSAPAQVDPTWFEKVTTATKETPEAWQTLRRSSTQPMHPLRLCQAIQPYLDDGAILVSDGGEFGQWVQAGLRAELSLINGPSGSIGSAIPLAIGAKKVCPERLVFACMGDGTFGFHGFELDTALRYDLPIICIVGNDARWNAEHQIQVRQYGPERTIGCELRPTRYDQVCIALGGYGEHIADSAHLEAAIARVVASKLPACLNVMIASHPAPSFLTSV